VEDPVVVSQGHVLAVVPIRPADAATTLSVGGRSVLDRTVRAIRAVPMVGRIVLALDGVDAAACLAAIEAPEELDVIATAAVVGRWVAVAAALELGGSSDRVLLHDPDRPLVAPSAISDLLRQSEGFDATLGALPVLGTLKRVVDGLVVATPPRESLRALQPPWVFDRGALEIAVRRAIAEGWLAADELALCLRAGLVVQVVEGEDTNVPIRSRADATYALSAVQAGRSTANL
jgi:2-C-methyl-D-erythritol 4-phosphate cytidylyltransferase